MIFAPTGIVLDFQPRPNYLYMSHRLFHCVLRFCEVASLISNSLRILSGSSDNLSLTQPFYGFYLWLLDRVKLLKAAELRWITTDVENRPVAGFSVLSANFAYFR